MPVSAPKFSGAERTFSRPRMERTTSGNRPVANVSGSFGFEIIRPPSIVPNAPKAGAVVDVRTIIEVDLSAVRTVLLTDDMAAYLGNILTLDGTGVSASGDLFDLTLKAEMKVYDHWRETEGPQRAQELWVLGQRVLKRAGTSTVQTLVATKTKRVRRMQYQRNA